MKKFWYIVAIFFIFSSCRKDDIKPSWDADLLVPIAYSKLSILDILTDSLEKINNDSSVSIVYQSNIASFTLDTVLKLPDTNFEYGASLEKLSLNPYTYNYRVSMGSIAMKDKEQNGESSPLYTTIMTAHNTGQPTQISSFGPYDYDQLQINMGNYFKYIYIRNAVLEIYIINQLPVPISNLAYKLIKFSNNEILINDSINLILPNTQQSRSFTLSNVVIDSLLVGSFKVSSPGSMVPVVIDTSQSATIKIVLRDLQIDSAVARFPSQELLNYNDVLRFNLPDSVQISEAWIKSGIMQFDFYNTLKENIHLKFQLPDAKKNGQVFEMLLTIPAASNGNVSHVNTQVDISDYKIKFRGIHQFEVIYGDLNNNSVIDSDTINSLYYNLKLSIDSSGNFVSLTKNDSIYANCTIKNVVPAYIKGFFGYKNVVLDSSTWFSLIKNIQAQSLHFDKTIFNLMFENQIGTIANIYIDRLKAKNTSQNNEINLQGSVLNTPFTIQKPSDPQSLQVDVQPAITSFTINHNNSNINDLVSILPDLISYKFSLKMNENVNLPSPSNANDFLYNGDKINLKLTAEVPLSFSTNKLVLFDTVESSIGKIDLSSINDGNLILNVKNFFPININLYIYALDSNKVLIDSLHNSPINIAAGIVNSVTLKVQQPSISRNILPFNNYKLQKILKAKYFAFKAIFNTIPSGKHVQIYDYYYLQINISGDFNYVINKPK